MKKHFYLLLFCLPLSSSMINSNTPKVQNVQFQQSGNQVIVTYNLVNTEDWQSFDVELFVSENNGYSYEGPLQKVKGDVGFDVRGGDGKRIAWDVLQERDEIVGNRIKFQVQATIKGRKPPENMIYIKKHYNEDANSSFNNFYICKYEVSNRDYCKFLNAHNVPKKKNPTQKWIIWNNPNCKIKRQGSWFSCDKQYNNLPVTCVTWYGAKAYCEWLSLNENKYEYRLPTVDEWEYAASELGKDIRFGNGNNIAISSEINFDAREDFKQSYSQIGQYRAKTVNVDDLKPNSLGLFNMSGNVSEWCEDSYSNNSLRILKGGAWRDSPIACQISEFSWNNPNFSDDSYGFRYVLTIK